VPELGLLRRSGVQLCGSPRTEYVLDPTRFLSFSWTETTEGGLVCTIVEGTLLRRVDRRRAHTRYQFVWLTNVSRKRECWIQEIYSQGCQWASWRALSKVYKAQGCLVNITLLGRTSPLSNAMEPCTRLQYPSNISAHCNGAHHMALKLRDSVKKGRSDLPSDPQGSQNSVPDPKFC
jgi:hypothetical protein